MPKNRVRRARVLLASAGIVGVSMIGGCTAPGLKAHDPYDLSGVARDADVGEDLKQAPEPSDGGSHD